ncbi:MAG: Gfo/Idh/MocA family protein [bacterium]|jgi:predicted dehydrogenase
MTENTVSRRIFIMGTAAAAAATMGSGTASAQEGQKKRTPSLKRLGYKSPNEKLNVAAIGAGGKGGSDIEKCSYTENIVALCDADFKRAGSIFRKFENAKKYKDFRKMLDNEPNIDACTISTPDHMHAMAAVWCMERGIHVYVQKPLTHDIYEARVLREVANHYGVASQMGNQGHSGDGVRRCCEIVWSGIIGDVKEVHAWTDRPIWNQGFKERLPEESVPEDVDWDLWLGNAPFVPFNGAGYQENDSTGYLPFEWRGWYDYGTGALGDMACHILDPANWALQLTAPQSVECIQKDVHSEYAYPNKSIVKFEFPARAGMGPVTLYWYDGGNMPPRPEGVADDEKLGDGDNGSYFVGTEGILTLGTYGGGTRLVGKKKGEINEEEIPYLIPRAPEGIGNKKDDDMRHTLDWLYAIKSGNKASANFDYSGPFTEWVVMGAIAQRVPGKLIWNAEKMEFLNSPEATALVKRKYRDGWSLYSREKLI